MPIDVHERLADPAISDDLGVLDFTLWNDLSRKPAYDALWKRLGA